METYNNKTNGDRQLCMQTNSSVYQKSGAQEQTQLHPDSDPAKMLALKSYTAPPLSFRDL